MRSVCELCDLEKEISSHCSVEDDDTQNSTFLLQNESLKLLRALHDLGRKALQLM